VTDEDLQKFIRAINQQIHEDFAPYWSMSATLRLEGRSTAEPEKLQMPDMPGDAMIYLWDQVDVPDALGYHFQNAQAIPYGFVFTEIARQIGEPRTPFVPATTPSQLWDGSAGAMCRGRATCHRPVAASSACISSPSAAARGPRFDARPPKEVPLTDHLTGIAVCVAPVRAGAQVVPPAKPS
jgi:hypothetical protein